MSLDDSPTYTKSELEAMTKTELLALASELGISGISSSNLKAEIIEAILNA